KLDPEKMIKGAWWRFKALPLGLQRGLAHSIARYVEKAAILRQDNESEEQLKLFLFTAVLELPESIVKLLQQFDYAQTIPKLVLFNNGSCGDMTRRDTAVLLLLNEMGLDIVIYNPTGQNDIEYFLKPELIDHHWLEEVSFEERFESHQTGSGSLFKKFIHKFL
ncbi:MAG TPA: YceG family protein, partial [Sporolactobacillaceae bacterium]|nr:YceG family protein [Sporolactobacillaceae bacterium]